MTEATPLLTIPQVAELAQLHRKTIERHIRAGRLGCVHLSEPSARRPEVRIRVEDYESWIESARVRPQRSRAVDPVAPQRGVAGGGRLRVVAGMGRDG